MLRHDEEQSVLVVGRAQEANCVASLERLERVLLQEGWNVL